MNVDREELAIKIGSDYNIDGHRIVNAIAQVGDFETLDILDNHLKLNDPDERIVAIKALGDARQALDVWPDGQ